MGPLASATRTPAGIVPAATTSLPVTTICTRGDRTTVTVPTPIDDKTPTSCGRSRRPV